jgi:hypothetical protein
MLAKRIWNLQIKTRSPNGIYLGRVVPDVSEAHLELTNKTRSPNGIYLGTAQSLLPVCPLLGKI